MSKAIEMVNGFTAIVDDEDYNRVKDIRWYAHKGKYAYNTKHGFLHRLIMNVTDGNLFVDHINHDTFDNRRSNLRVVTKQQNAFNKVAHVKSSTGFKGVQADRRFSKRLKKYTYKYKTCLYLNGKRHYFGTFSTPIEAARRYNEIAPLYFGEYAYLNDLGGATM